MLRVDKGSPAVLEETPQMLGDGFVLRKEGEGNVVLGAVRRFSHAMALLPNVGFVAATLTQGFMERFKVAV
jgi:hypothetical protein